MKHTLYDYFPENINKKYASSIDKHPLRDEIISTHIANSLVNRVGPTFLNEMMDISGAKLTEVIHAYLVVKESFGLESFWTDIEGLDYKIPADIQMHMLIDIVELIEKNVLWLLHKNKSLDLEGCVKLYSKKVNELHKCAGKNLSSIVSLAISKKQDGYKQKQVPAEIAEKFSELNLMNYAYLLIDLSISTKVGIEKTSQMFHKIGDRLGIDWLLSELKKQSSENTWTKKALYNLRDQLIEIKDKICFKLLTHYKDLSMDEAIETWLRQNNYLAEKAEEVLESLKDNDKIDPTMLYVAVRQLASLV